VIRGFFGRWLLRLLVPLVLVVLFIVQGVPGAILGWAVTGYLLWRAAPGVRRDLRRLWSVRSRSARSMARF
jgi:hypothetical protein